MSASQPPEILILLRRKPPPKPEEPPMPKRVTQIRIPKRNLRGEIEQEFREAKAQGVRR
jgi:hypothetical protein